MAFRDLTDVLGTTPPKVLPIQGQAVEFPGVISAWAGALLLAVEQAARDGLDQQDWMSDEDGVALEAELLGDGAAELNSLGVVGEARMHVLQTLTVWHLGGREAAEAAWEGKEQARNRASKRAAGRSLKKAPTPDGGARGRSRVAAGASSAAPKTPRGRTSRAG